MFIESVLVCVDYSDKLSAVIKQNKRHFDNYVVVTIDRDINTQNLCKRNNVKCVITKRLYDGGEFNKSKALNDGIKYLKRKDWVLITDADILLHDKFRDKISSLCLNQDHIYGVGRYICNTKDDLNKYLRSSAYRNTFEYDARFGMGFFQLFNVKSKTLSKSALRYAEEFGRCDKGDNRFFRMWSRDDRKKLDLDVIHLGDIGIDWCGRKSDKFV